MICVSNKERVPLSFKLYAPTPTLKGWDRVKMVVGWLLVGYWLVVGWLLVGCWLVIGWLLGGYLLVVICVSNDINKSCIVNIKYEL